LRIRINSRRGQEFFELPEAVWEHLFPQLRKPFQRARLFQVGVGKFSNLLGEERDDVHAKAACPRRLRRRQGHRHQNACGREPADR